MHAFSRIAALAVALGLLATPALAQQPVQASQLLGKPVAGGDGKDVGALHDLIIDTKEGRIAYAVVIVGMKLVAVPVAAGAGGDRIAVGSTLQALRGEPGFSETTYPDFNAGEPDGEGKVRYRALRRMLDTDLKSLDGKDVGDVKDLLVTLEDAAVRNVVVEFDRTWYDKEGWVALPPQSVLHRGDEVVANFVPDHVRTAAEARAAREKAEAERKAAEAAARNLDHDVRASRVIGRKVVDAQGAGIGKIEDLLVELATGRLTHAVVATQGGSRALPLPAPGAFRHGEAIAIDPRKLVAPPAADGRLRRASRLLDTELEDHAGEDVGDVRELIVNLGTGRLRYAVAQFIPAWVAAGKVVALPLREVREDGGKPVMRSGLHQLQGALIFDDKAWPDLDHPQYRAYMDQYLANTKN